MPARIPPQLADSRRWNFVGIGSLDDSNRGLAVSRESPDRVDRISSHTVPKFMTTNYFRSIRSRPDRAMIRDEWIERAMASPEREQVQHDGRLRLWARIPEAEGRYLRVILLPDRLTVHNAFFDRGFKP